ncbi:hypothetical protein, partial [Shigella sonnei]|uniref:hypothetical protein n=1 Tax=Shigella sonnei TaxID=624 RepID=UPI001C0A7532
MPISPLSAGFFVASSYDTHHKTHCVLTQENKLCLISISKQRPTRERQDNTSSYPVTEQG